MSGSKEIKITDLVEMCCNFPIDTPLGKEVHAMV